MKNLNFVKQVLIACIVILAVSCSKDKTGTPMAGERKVFAIVNVDYQDSIAFIYDSNNAIIKATRYLKSSKTTYDQVYTADYEYYNGKLVKIEAIDSISDFNNIDSIFYDSEGKLLKKYKYSYNSGSFFSKDTTVFSYGTDNQLNKITSKNNDIQEFTYTNGNITKVENPDIYNSNVTTHTYDNNINPFKGNPYFFLQEKFFNINNVLGNDYSDQVTSYTATYTYIYDNFGYPVKITYRWSGNDYVQIIYYK